MNRNPLKGPAVRKIRMAAGISAVRLADAAGVSPHQLSRVENGHIEPSKEWLKIVVDELGKLLIEKVAGGEAIKNGSRHGEAA